MVSFYVGKSSSSNTRYLGSGLHIVRAVRKYGRENFEKEILEEVNNNQIDEREKFWIDKLQAISKGYNISIGGEGGPNFAGKTHSIEVRKRLSEISKLQKGKHLSEKHKASLKIAMRGNKSRTGLKNSLEHREKIRE